MKLVMMLTFFNRLKKMLNYGGVDQLHAGDTSSHLMPFKIFPTTVTTTFFCTSVSKLFDY